VQAMLGSVPADDGASAKIAEVLADTGLVAGEASADALLDKARNALAAEVGQEPDRIALEAAALKVATDHWTRQAGDDSDALRRAQQLQDRLTTEMAPLRELQRTLAALRELRPKFNEAEIEGLGIGELQVPLSALVAGLPPREAAQWRADVAKQLLEQHRQGQEESAAKVIAPTPVPDPVQTFLDTVEPKLQSQWRERLTGGENLDALLAKQTQLGRALTQQSVEQLVADNKPVLKPPRLPGRLGMRFKIEPNTAYAVSYKSKSDFIRALGSAVQGLPDEPMQIRTPDNARRFDLHRHPQDGGDGLMIFDQLTGDALDVASHENIAPAVADALGIQANDSGAIVVSYGGAPEVMSDSARFYWTREQIQRWFVAPLHQRSPISARTSNDMSRAVAQWHDDAAAWDARQDSIVGGALRMMRTLGVGTALMTEDNAREFANSLRELGLVQRAGLAGDAVPAHLSSLDRFAAHLAQRPEALASLADRLLPPAAMYKRLRDGESSDGAASLALWQSIFATPDAARRESLAKLAWADLVPLVNSHFRAQQSAQHDTPPDFGPSFTHLEQHRSQLPRIGLRDLGPTAVGLDRLAMRAGVVDTLHRVRAGIARGEAQSPDGWMDLHALVTDRLLQVNSVSMSFLSVTEIVDVVDRLAETILWDVELAAELLEKARVDIDNAARGR
jgi:hypothetical protein